MGLLPLLLVSLILNLFLILKNYVALPLPAPSINLETVTGIVDGDTFDTGKRKG